MVDIIGVIDYNKIKQKIKEIFNLDVLNNLLTERITGQSGLRESAYTINSGTTYVVVKNETVILKDSIYADGDLYVEGVLEVM